MPRRGAGSTLGTPWPLRACTWGQARWLRPGAPRSAAPAGTASAHVTPAAGHVITVRAAETPVSLGQPTVPSAASRGHKALRAAAEVCVAHGRPVLRPRPCVIRSSLSRSEAPEDTARPCPGKARGGLRALKRGQRPPRTRHSRAPRARGVLGPLPACAGTAPGPFLSRERCQLSSQSARRSRRSASQHTLSRTHREVGSVRLRAAQAQC